MSGMNKSERWAMALLRWSENNKIPFDKCVKLAFLSRKVFAAGVWACNHGSRETKRNKFYWDLEEAAHDSGLLVLYPGLNPHFWRSGEDLGPVPSL
jgi:hypothetical protein